MPRLCKLCGARMALYQGGFWVCTICEYAEEAKKCSKCGCYMWEDNTGRPICGNCNEIAGVEDDLGD